MLPKWFRAYLREESYLKEKIDLLIVDEAAQVSPEVGAVVCALAKQVCVVGDVHQIEPVQVIPEALDLVNVRRYLHIEDESEIDELISQGFLASSGSPPLTRSEGGFILNSSQCCSGIFLNRAPKMLTSDHRLLQ